MRQNWHFRCPNMQHPALAPSLKSSAGRVYAVNSNLPVHSLQTVKTKTEQKQTREKYCDYNKATSTTWT